MKKRFRCSTLVQIFMMLISLCMTGMFFLPLFKDSVTYSNDFFTSKNLLDFYPDGAVSYMELAGKFLDNGNAPVFVMIIALLLVLPILLILISFPKARRFTYMSIIPIIGIVLGHAFLSLGFVVEQKALEFTLLGYIYSALASQLLLMYIFFLIMSIIEASQFRKEAKLAAKTSGVMQGQKKQNKANKKNEETKPNEFYSGAPENGPYTKEEDDYQKDSEAADTVKEFDVKANANDDFENASMTTDSNKEIADDATNIRDNGNFSNVNEVENDDKSSSKENVAENASFSGKQPDADESVKMAPKFCQVCGAKLEEGAQFCIQCGSMVVKQ